MKKPLAAIFALAFIAALTSCAPEPVATSGDACDPHAMTDMECAAENPDHAVLNMLSDTRSREPLASMSDAEKIALAHKACELSRIGLTAKTTTLVRTLPWPGEGREVWDSNDIDIFEAALVAYCPE